MERWLFAIVFFMFFCLFSLQSVPVWAFENTSRPKKIIIPTVGISLPVYVAKIALNTWEVRIDGASFGESTANPGEKGNTVIFSHATAPLFGNLPLIKKGDIIHIFTTFDWFAYRVTEINVIPPEKTDVLFSDGSHTLTLYTCTGPNDEKRFVVKATLLP